MEIWIKGDSTIPSALVHMSGRKQVNNLKVYEPGHRTQSRQLSLLVLDICISEDVVSIVGFSSAFVDCGRSISQLAIIRWR